jgi:uncharacterized membrane protein
LLFRTKKLVIITTHGLLNAKGGPFIVMNTTNDKVIAGALMVMAGGLVGASLALLFAPQS